MNPHSPPRPLPSIVRNITQSAVILPPVWTWWLAATFPGAKTCIALSAIVTLVIWAIVGFKVVCLTLCRRAFRKHFKSMLPFQDSYCGETAFIAMRDFARHCLVESEFLERVAQVPHREPTHGQLILALDMAMVDMGMPGVFTRIEKEEDWQLAIRKDRPLDAFCKGCLPA